MSFMQRSPKLCINLPEMDQEHIQLVALVNQLHDAMKAGKAHDELGRVLDNLVDYTQKHFKHEEELMHKIGYNLAASHRSKHRQLTDEVLKKKVAVARGEIVPATEILRFLQSWLIDHIQTEDRAYAEFAARKTEVTQKAQVTR